MSNSAVLIRPQEEVHEVPWIEMNDLSEVHPGSFADSEAEFTEMEVPVVSFETQEALRFGPRTYTPEQADVIHLAVRQRKPLATDPLPFDE
ncbi:MAG: hypothetical protein WD404_02630 [Solirubrobacterales bacterium]